MNRRRNKQTWYSYSGEFENLALSLVDNSVIFRYNHPSLIFKFAASRFVNVSENEINMRKENAIPRNIRHATESSVKLENSATTDFEPILAYFLPFS